MTVISFSTSDPAYWANPAFESDTKLSLNNQLAEETDCPLYDDAVDTSGSRDPAARSPKDIQNSTKGFLAQPDRLPCARNHVDIDRPDPELSGVDVAHGLMRNRIDAYKRIIQDVDFILGSIDKNDVMPNPLTVRAWFFNIGLAFSKLGHILKEAEQVHCAERETRVEKILEIFRRNNIITLACNAIRARQPAYTETLAREKTEQLVRYAFKNSI